MDTSQRLWESLRADVRQVDQVLDQQIAQLGDLANIDEGNVNVNVGTSSSSSALNNNNNGSHARSTLVDNADTGAPQSEPRRTMAEVQRQFDELRATIESNLAHYERQLQAMSAGSAGNLTATRHTERFHGLLQEKRRTVLKTCAEFKKKREQLELLPSIAVDLRNYENEAGTRLLMDEQNAIRHAHGRVTQIVEQATSTQARLRGQRDRFSSMGDRLLQIAERIPVIQQVLKRIDSRRRVHVVILGTVLSFCILVTVIFW